MLTPYVIMVLGYCMLAALCLWFIKEVKGMWPAKFTIVPMAIWFGLFLYFIPPQLAGYPSEQELIDDKVVVSFFTYESPSDESEGAIYVVVDTRFFRVKAKSKTFIDYFKPKTYTDISKQEYLRLYRLPWDESMVKEMTKAKSNKKLIVLTKKKGGKDGKDGKAGNQQGGKGGKKPGAGAGKGKEGEGEEGKKGGTGGTESGSKNSKYNVEGLTPNEVIGKD